ncbi:unnamed protein product [Urochloa humidicola]
MPFCEIQIQIHKSMATGAWLLKVQERRRRQGAPPDRGLRVSSPDAGAWVWPPATERRGIAKQEFAQLRRPHRPPHPAAALVVGRREAASPGRGPLGRSGGKAEARHAVGEAAVHARARSGHRRPDPASPGPMCAFRSPDPSAKVTQKPIWDWG